jgi:hypothetical protein
MQSEKYLKDNGFSKPSFIENYSKVASKVKEIDRKSVIPKNESSLELYSQNQLNCQQNTAVHTSRIAKEVFPKATTGLSLLTSSSFIKKDGSPMNKTETDSFLNDYWGRRKIYSEIKKFINFVINSTYTTSEAHDALELSVEEIQDLEVARRNVSEANKTLIQPIQSQKSRSKLTGHEIKKKEKSFYSVVGHPRNVLSSIISASPTDVNFEKHGVLERDDCGQEVLASVPPQHHEKLKFRLNILDAYRKCKSSGEVFYLQNWVINFPNSELYLLWEQNTATYDRVISENTDDDGSYSNV